jgi:nucleotide-binding universal stress UspA family protein
MLEIRSILHPTDVSEASGDAFVHALRIAIAAKATFTILHVAGARQMEDWNQFPRVRRTLANWGLIDETEPLAAITDKLGVTVRKVQMKPQSTVDGLMHFLDAHAADLIVLATEGRQGVAQWLNGSIAEDLARHAETPTLFVPAQAHDFVDARRGEVHLRRVLIPVDNQPKPAAAVAAIMDFARMMAGVEAEERLLHVGHDAPTVQRHSDPRRTLPVAIGQGDPVDAIIDAANDWPADLIGMATAGHHGFLDALRGSTTERVVRQAPCPVLAVPVAG